MKISKKGYRKLPFSRLFCDYVDEHSNISPFFTRQHNYEQLKEVISTYQYPCDRRAAADIIRSFNQDFSLAPEALKNLDALSDNDTVTITTGQQVSLLGGPLYTIFKTLSVIHLARMLTRDTGRNVVPVFWLADEDHDFDEIAAVRLPDKQSLRVITHTCNDCARHAAADIRVDANFDLFRTEVFKSLPETDFHQDLMMMTNECYVTGRTFGHAFGALMVRLFSRHGLILAGSNLREAKVFTKEKIRIAIERSDEIRTSLSEQSELISRHYHQQAQVLDSLLFWHDKDAGRVRLIRENGLWSREPGVSLTTSELFDELEQQPEKFSPNVFLRPVIQDTLLPNAAYIGGPAEIAYYGQMKKLYKLFEQPMPFIAGRFSATLIEPPVTRLMNDLPYEMPDYADRLEDLEQRYLRTHGEPDLDRHFEFWKEEIGKLSNQMADTINFMDPGLKKHSQAITKEHQNAIDKLKKKLVHAVRTKEEVQINRIGKVKGALFPGDHLQEREISFIYFMNKYGIDIWDRLLENIETGEEGIFSKHYVINL